MTNLKLHNRLQRLEGQLQKLQKNIDDNQDCSEVIPQFLAVKGAIAAAFDEYVKISLDTCATKDQRKMKKLVSLLVRN